MMKLGAVRAVRTGVWRRHRGNRPNTPDERVKHIRLFFIFKIHQTRLNQWDLIVNYDNCSIFRSPFSHVDFSFCTSVVLGGCINSVLTKFYVTLHNNVERD